MMGEKTEYLNLYKWDKADKKITTINNIAANAEIIDNKLKEHNNNIISLSENKLESSGNFKGTWNGMTQDEMLSKTGGNHAYIEVLDSDPVAPFVGQIWMIRGAK